MNAFYEHRSCSPSLTAKILTGATAGCRQQSSLVGTSRGSGVKRARMRGDDDIHWANRSEHLLSRRLVAPLSRTSLMLSSVKTEQA